MNHLTLRICAAPLLCYGILATGEVCAQAPAANQDRFFTETIHPILAERCWECHGGEVQESGLRLDSRDSLLAGGDSGQPLVVPGKPAESFLIRVIQHDGDVAMPPDEKLPEEEIKALSQWVSMGLPWPTSGAGKNEPATKEEQYVKQLAEHWAFQPITPPQLPEVQRPDWIAQPVDRFVLAHLESKEITPSPEADRHTLIRRLKFDLLGLPPTYEEVQSFVSDSAPDAYEQLAERYLASPHYGERWGRHWLDLARYADTRGYAFARERRYPYAYTYRDYVIHALNDDLPFDQFVVQQLAADLITDAPHDAALAALGFLTVGRKFNNRHLDIDDQIDVVGRGLLGLTVACARCHDHKYDPIPTDDYYSLYGVFASSSEPDELPTIGDPTKTPGYDEFKKELERRQGELEAFQLKKRDELAETARTHATDYLARAVSKVPEESLQDMPFIELKGEQFKPRLVQRWREQLAKTAKADDPVLGPLVALALIPDDAFSQQSVDILAKLREVPAGTERGQLNPLVKEALEKKPATK